MRGGAPLGDGQQQPAVVPPGVEVRAGQRLQTIKTSASQLDSVTSLSVTILYSNTQTFLFMLLLDITFHSTAAIDLVLLSYV